MLIAVCPLFARRLDLGTGKRYVRVRCPDGMSRRHISSSRRSTKPDPPRITSPGKKQMKDFEDDKQRRKRRLQDKRRDRDRHSRDNKWWSPDLENKPRRKNIKWDSFDEDEDEYYDDE